MSSSSSKDTHKEPLETYKKPTDKASKKRQWHRRPGRKIDDLLHKRHQRYAPLTRLISDSEQRQSLTQTVRALLPDTLAEAVYVTNYRAPTLILRVNNASLATRLRYLIPDLTTKLTVLADFRGLNRVSLRVVHTAEPQKAANPPRYLSSSAVNSLTEIANSLDDSADYQDLRAAFLRLSNHQRPDTVKEQGE